MEDFPINDIASENDSLANNIYAQQGFLVDQTSFSGPIDLLLHLVKKHELEITKMSLAEVCDQYLEYVETVKALGYSSEFIRMWEFYLCYCEGGFIEQSISDVHMQFIKSGNNNNNVL